MGYFLRAARASNKDAAPKAAPIIALSRASTCSPITAPFAPGDMIEANEAALRAEQADAADPIERAEHTDPIDPNDRADPTDPTERTEPLEAIDSRESSDQSDHRELVDMV